MPVLARHADLVDEQALHAGERWIVRPDRSPTVKRISAYIHSQHPDPRLPLLSPSRCRATWIRSHLLAGTRLDVLMAAAGYTTVMDLQPHLKSMPQPGPASLRDPRRGQPSPAVPSLHSAIPR